MNETTVGKAYLKGKLFLLYSGQKVKISGLGGDLIAQPIQNERVIPVGSVNHRVKGLLLRKVGPVIGSRTHLFVPC